MMSDESRMPSRARLLLAAKALMAEGGYEQTSTAAIARAAATSESQLMRYFGGKAGLLQAIFDESWQSLNTRLRVISSMRDTRHALSSVLAMFIGALDQDPELAALFLFEGRRVRGPQQEIALSEGYFEFMRLLHQLIERGQRDGALGRTFHPEAVVSALFGAAEGMVRERAFRRRRGAPAPFTDADILRVFDALLDGLAPQKKAPRRKKR